MPVPTKELSDKRLLYTQLYCSELPQEDLSSDSYPIRPLRKQKPYGNDVESKDPI